MQQCRQMSHHALQLHVVGFGGGLDMSVDVHVDRAVGHCEIATEELLPSAVYRIFDGPCIQQPCAARKRSGRRESGSMLQASRPATRRSLQQDP